jgi:hypothetical protein
MQTSIGVPNSGIFGDTAFCSTGPPKPDLLAQPGKQNTTGPTPLLMRSARTEVEEEV